MSDPTNKLQQLREELKNLDIRREEIATEIRRMQNSIEQETEPAVEGTVNARSAESEKIQLFHSLFAGRDDVFPRRFESRKSGRSGYQPACKNEWRAGICLKPKIKCAKCEYREFIPVTDAIIRQHLSGKGQDGKPFVMGIYPLRSDETCSFLAADFDKAEWQHDAAAFLDTCDEFKIPAYLERSRSGNGGHVWIFFKEPITAGLARKLGFHILTIAMENRPELGFDSYDRLFPNQDRMPSGGFGNLIALPLQKQARGRDNSVFVDRSFTPYPDQWSFLSGIRKTGLDHISELVETAEKDDLILGVRAAPEEDDSTPWLLPPSRKTNENINGPHPQRLKIVLANQIYIPRKDLSPSLRNALLRLAAFPNPEFHKAQAMRMPVYGKPRIIACAEEFSEHIALPRGCLKDALDLLDKLDIESETDDQRNHGNATDFSFSGELRDEQMLAGKALLKHDIGILSAPTAFGKTVLAAWLIAQRKTNVLVLVHRRQLMEQWQTRLSTFLGIPPKEIGLIGGGKRKPAGAIDVGVIQSLNKKGAIDDLVANYGYIIIDECHHISAKSFEDVLRACSARYVAGLSATLTRRDGHHPIVFMQCGPVRYRAHDKKHAMQRPFDHKVIVHKCNEVEFKEDEEESNISDIYSRLIHSPERNRRIADDAIEAYQAGRSPLVLTDRVHHLELLHEMLSKKIDRIVLLKGGLGKKRMKTIMDKLSEWKDLPHAVLATGRYLGEGFDDPRLDTLFLAMPVSWKGILSQYAGRLHRLHHDKTEVSIHDYVDENHPILVRMFGRRIKGYEALGYQLPTNDKLLL